MDLIRQLVPVIEEVAKDPLADASNLTSQAQTMYAVPFLAKDSLLATNLQAKASCAQLRQSLITLANHAAVQVQEEPQFKSVHEHVEGVSEVIRGPGGWEEGNWAK